MLDNSKIINLLLESPQKQQRLDLSSDPVQKYAGTTPKIAEVSEEHEDSELKSSIKEESRTEKSGSHDVELDNKNKPITKTFDKQDARLLRYSSSTGEFRENRLRKSSKGIQGSVGESSPQISLVKNHQIIQDIKSSLDSLHLKFDEINSKNKISEISNFKPQSID